MRREVVRSTPRPAPKQARALWVSSSLSTYGGIATFVRNMRDTPLWEDWHIRHVATHTDGSKFKRARIFATGSAHFLLELVFYRPSVVHLHTSERGSFFRKGLLVWVSSLFRIPTVLHMHGGEFHEYHDAASARTQRIIRATLERTDAVVALGNAWAVRLKRAAPDAHVVVIPNGIRLQDAVNQDAADHVQVVFLGELCDRKGTTVLIDAWAAMTATEGITPTTLVIAGWGEVERARTQIASLGVTDSVHLAGWLSAPQTHELLAHTHILVLPSINEGQPMAILEAMTRGICVVSTTVGGIPEMIGEADGVLVKPGDPGELADALFRMVCNADERHRLGANARQRVQREFDVDVVSRRLEDLYREITTGGSPVSGIEPSPLLGERLGSTKRVGYA